MKTPKTHPTNPRLHWVIRYGSGSWEVEPCQGNALPELPPAEKKKHLLNGYLHDIPESVAAYDACRLWQAAKGKRVREQRKHGTATVLFKKFRALELIAEKTKIQKQNARCVALGKPKPKSRIDRGLSLDKRAPATKYTPEVHAITKKIYLARKSALTTNNLKLAAEWDAKAVRLMFLKDRMLIALEKKRSNAKN